MKDMGLLKYCLGIEFEQNLEKHEIKMHQQCYANEVIKRFRMENSNTVSTPLAANGKLSKDMTSSDQEGSPEIKDLPYQSLIGSLMYLAVCTRPYISRVVSLLSQFNSNFTQQHWTAAKRVLRYLKPSEKSGLTFKKTDKNLFGYADADWGSNIDDRRSFTGFAFMVAIVAVSWESRKQRTVALSTTEAE